MAKEEREAAGYPGRHKCGWVPAELSCVAGLCWGNGLEGLAALAGDKEEGARVPWAARKAGTPVTLWDVCCGGWGVEGSEAWGVTLLHKPHWPQPRTAAAGRRVAGPRKC